MWTMNRRRGHGCPWRARRGIGLCRQQGLGDSAITRYRRKLGAAGAHRMSSGEGERRRRHDTRQDTGGRGNASLACDDCGPGRASRFGQGVLALRGRPRRVLTHRRCYQRCGRQRLRDSRGGAGMLGCRLAAWRLRLRVRYESPPARRGMIGSDSRRLGGAVLKRQKMARCPHPSATVRAAPGRQPGHGIP